MSKTNFNSKLPGYNLTEILVVIAIIGILILIALPDQTATISKAKAIEAKAQLQHLHSLEKMYFYERSKYSNSLIEIGFEQAKLITDDGNANYTIEIVSADHNGFLARATAVVDFDGDGEINVWEVDQDKNIVEVQKD